MSFNNSASASIPAAASKKYNLEQIEAQAGVYALLLLSRNFTDSLLVEEVGYLLYQEGYTEGYSLEEQMEIDEAVERAVQVAQKDSKELEDSLTCSSCSSKDLVYTCNSDRCFYAYKDFCRECRDLIDVAPHSTLKSGKLSKRNAFVCATCKGYGKRFITDLNEIAAAMEAIKAPFIYSAPQAPVFTSLWEDEEVKIASLEEIEDCASDTAYMMVEESPKKQYDFMFRIGVLATLKSQGVLKGHKTNIGSLALDAIEKGAKRGYSLFIASTQPKQEQEEQQQQEQVEQEEYSVPAPVAALSEDMKAQAESEAEIDFTPFASRNEVDTSILHLIEAVQYWRVGILEEKDTSVQALTSEEREYQAHHYQTRLNRAIKAKNDKSYAYLPLYTREEIEWNQYLEESRGLEEVERLARLDTMLTYVQYHSEAAMNNCPCPVNHLEELKRNQGSYEALAKEAGFSNASSFGFSHRDFDGGKSIAAKAHRWYVEHKAGINPPVAEKEEGVIYLCSSCDSKWKQENLSLEGLHICPICSSQLVYESNKGELKRVSLPALFLASRVKGELELRGIYMGYNPYHIDFLCKVCNEMRARDSVYCVMHRERWEYLLLSGGRQEAEEWLERNEVSREEPIRIINKTAMESKPTAQLCSFCREMRFPYAFKLNGNYTKKYTCFNCFSDFVAEKQKNVYVPSVPENTWLSVCPSAVFFTATGADGSIESGSCFIWFVASLDGGMRAFEQYFFMLATNNLPSKGLPYKLNSYNIMRETEEEAYYFEQRRQRHIDLKGHSTIQFFF